MVRVWLTMAAMYFVLCALAYGQNTTPGTTPRSASTGSGTRLQPEVTAVAPAVERDTTEAVLRRSRGSLMRAAMVSADANPPQPMPANGACAALKTYSLFAVPEPEPKTLKKHDVVTIIVREESEFSSQGSSDLKRSSDLEAKIDQLIKLNLSNFSLENAITGASPSIKMSSSRNFKGEATVDRTDSFTVRITAEILDVKPNGTLVLQARKKIRNDAEEQLFICSGICRVEDITPDNTVLSTQLFDLEVTKTSKGQVRSSTEKGAIGKLLDFINPF